MEIINGHLKGKEIGTGKKNNFKKILKDLKHSGFDAKKFAKRCANVEEMSSFKFLFAMLHKKKNKKEKDTKQKQPPPPFSTHFRVNNSLYETIFFNAIN